MKGLSQFERNLDRIIANLDNDVFKALEQEAQTIIENSKTLIPVDTGAARDSEVVKSDKDSKTIILGYGRPDATLNPKSGEHPAEYAAKIHETHPTKAKFLENPVRTWGYEAESRLGGRLNGNK